MILTYIIFILVVGFISYRFIRRRMHKKYVKRGIERLEKFVNKD